MVGARNAVAGLLGLSLILVGVSFLAFGLASVLATTLGLAGGAAVTGLLLLLPPLLWAMFKRPSLPAPDTQTAPAGYESVWAGELARLAHRKPLLAVLVAIVAGAASTLLKRA